MENQLDETKKLPKWVFRSIVFLLAGIAGLWYLRGVVSALRPLLIIFLVSLFLSFALEPAVNRLEKLGIRRGIGTGISFLLCFAAIGGFGFQVGSLLAEQVNEFSENVPSYLSDIDEFLDENFGIENYSYPSYPSHIDHILISNELFNYYNSQYTETYTIQLDDEIQFYFNYVSDHLPVYLKLVFE